ncbi:MAG: 3,4-dihydroxy-2-butanone-4-phosphate synthase [Veillonella sp.]
MNVVGSRVAAHKKNIINFMWLNTRVSYDTPMRAEALRKQLVLQWLPKILITSETAFTVTVDHVDTTTGVSPAERCLYEVQKLLES